MTQRKRRRPSTRRPRASHSDRPRAAPLHLRLQHPGELLALVPYLFGFETTDSVVAVGLDDGLFQASCRLDLAAVADQPELVVNNWRRVVRGTPAARTVMLLGYGSDACVVSQVLDVAAIAFHADPTLRLTGCAHTDGEHWWWRGAAPGSGTGEKSRYDPCPPVVAEAIARGMATLESRERLAASVQGPAGSSALHRLGEIGAQLCIIEQWSLRDRLVELDRLLVAGVGDPEQLAAHETDRLVALVHDPITRDHAWLGLDRARAEDHHVLWHHLCTIAPDRYALPVLGLLGFSAWAAGHGALANCAAARAGEIDPNYRMVQLLNQLLQAGAPPAIWDELRAGCLG